MIIKDIERVLAEEFSSKELTENANPKNTDSDCSGLCEKTVNGVSFDSRTVREGHIFVAIKGLKSDGHEYIPSAIEKGAVAVICEDVNKYSHYKALYHNIYFCLVRNARIALSLVSKEFYENCTDSLCLIGITGTKGKTSTSFMIARILRESGKKVGIIGTTGAYCDGFYEEMEHSTPESRDLYRLFYEMYKRGTTHIVMEVSSQAILMNRVYGMHFDTAIFTNITPDHIGEGEHSDFDDYLYCKGKLFAMCTNAVVNLDSDKSGYILDICRSNNVNVYTYAVSDKSADYIAKNEQFFIKDGMRTKYELCRKDHECSEIEVSVPGKFSVFNSLCACATASVYNASISDMQNALKDVKVIGRIEPVPNKYCKAPVIIDYAHNAVSLESLFTAISAYSPKRMICVFGCGGNRSKLRRYEMGEISGKYADLSVITTDNSRFEELDDIIADILVGMGKTDGKYVIIKDRLEAIHYAMRIAEEGDVVLLAGKGQETYLDIKGVKTHFDEREAVARFLS